MLNFGPKRFWPHRNLFLHMYKIYLHFIRIKKNVMLKWNSKVVILNRTYSYILVVIGIDYIGSCKSNYHTIMTTTALYGKWRKSSLSVCRFRVGQQIDPGFIWSEALFGLSLIIQIYPYRNETQWLFWGPTSWINIDYNGENVKNCLNQTCGKLPKV
jgi:hypothetical protein